MVLKCFTFIYPCQFNNTVQKKCQPTDIVLMKAS
ncbi:hypothetical protein T06_5910 [Trichinella sp. T6]|nr:hypothetical protein T06_5910 [Trichinella sp. T6]